MAWRMGKPFSFAVGARQEVSPGRFQPLVLAGLVFGFLLAAARAPALEFPREFILENAEFAIYAPGTLKEIAVCRTEKIFTDHRKFLFFRVKLLPLLVVQGVRLEFAGENPDHNWTESFLGGWLPDIKRSAVEWRDVDITSQRKTAPRLHADQVWPATGGAAPVCTLENVTLEAGGAKWRMAKAELREEGGRPRVVWTDGGTVRHEDLFSGEMVETQKSKGPIK